MRPKARSQSYRRFVRNVLFTEGAVTSAVLLHKNRVTNFCDDGSEIDSYSSKILIFVILNIVFRFNPLAPEFFF
jgi:hypothetical protein